ncbi:MAG TPA: GNAT family N-acetyltransferase [Allosphingosinicella sp.]|jgi:RimJ/RimL family protein N-acetyltransferase
MTLQLVPLAAGDDAQAIAQQLAPGFGGDMATPLATIEGTLAMLEADPRPHPWGAYLAYEGETPVGTCAFKAAPDESGAVEIAYFTFPAFERRGHAVAMAAALTNMAIEAGAPTVVAHTLPEENASNRALRRNGFAFAGDVVDPEDGLVWRWERTCRD